MQQPSASTFLAPNLVQSFPLHYSYSNLSHSKLSPQHLPHPIPPSEMHPMANALPQSFQNMTFVNPSQTANHRYIIVLPSPIHPNASVIAPHPPSHPPPHPQLQQQLQRTAVLTTPQPRFSAKGNDIRPTFSMINNAQYPFNYQHGGLSNGPMLTQCQSTLIKREPSPLPPPLPLLEAPPQITEIWQPLPLPLLNEDIASLPSLQPTEHSNNSSSSSSTTHSHSHNSSDNTVHHTTTAPPSVEGKLTTATITPLQINASAAQNSTLEIEPSASADNLDDGCYKPQLNVNKPWQCPHNGCGRLFVRKRSLHTHYRIHTEKAAQCSHCGRKFGRKSNLTEHMRIHTGEKPFHCETCGKCFRQRHILTEHRRTHTGERPFICDICDKRFSVKHNLYAHKRTVHLPNGLKTMYTCEICQKQFKSKHGWKGHMKKQH